MLALCFQEKYPLLYFCHPTQPHWASPLALLTIIIILHFIQFLLLSCAQVYRMWAVLWGALVSVAIHSAYSNTLAVRSEQLGV